MGLRKVVLSTDFIRQFRNVRKVKGGEDEILAPGAVFALEGAWDRKKIVTDIRELSVDECSTGLWYASDTTIVRGYEVTLQNIGRVYNDGRWMKPVRASAPMKQCVYFCLCNTTSKARILYSGGMYRWVVPYVPSVNQQAKYDAGNGWGKRKFTGTNTVQL